MPPLAPDWADVFAPSTPILETFIRATLTYLFLFGLLRFAHKRQAGALGMTDILVLVLLADAAQNAMADDYRSVTDGALLVTTIVGWSVALEWLGYHVPWVEQFVHPAPLTLIEDGRMIRTHMRKELVTYDELMTLLREQGVEDVRDVKHALMEGDGQLSVVRMDQESTVHRRRRRGDTG